jgi:hypothetical protein
MTWPTGPRLSPEDRLKEMYREKEYLLIQLEKLEQDIKVTLEKVG